MVLLKLLFVLFIIIPLAFTASVLAMPYRFLVHSCGLGKQMDDIDVQIDGALRRKWGPPE